MAWTDSAKRIRVGELRPDLDNPKFDDWISISDPLKGQETTHSPSLTGGTLKLGGELILAYSGTDDDHFIYLMIGEMAFEPPYQPIFNRRVTLPDSSPPAGPAMASIPASYLRDFDATYMGYVRGDNHHINLIKIG
jgi:hypothetical protein